MHVIAKEHLVIEKIHRPRRRRESAVSRPRGRRPRTRRRATASTALLATSAALVLAACGGTAASSSSSSTPASGVVDITWQTMWSGNTLTLLSQMVNEFNARSEEHTSELQSPCN